jgi:NADPH-ferrihemoprotein reductase
VVDLEDLSQEDLAEVPLAIFAVATYGDGEPTDNARPFHEWISKDDQEEGYLNG